MTLSPADLQTGDKITGGHTPVVGRVLVTPRREGVLWRVVVRGAAGPVLLAPAARVEVTR